MAFVLYVDSRYRSSFNSLRGDYSPERRNSHNLFLTMFDLYQCATIIKVSSMYLRMLRICRPFNVSHIPFTVPMQTMFICIPCPSIPVKTCQGYILSRTRLRTNHMFAFISLACEDH